jgi:maleate isomerase
MTVPPAMALSTRHTERIHMQIAASAKPENTTTAPAREPEYGERLRIGMMLPCRNTVAEADMHSLLPAGIALITTRLRLLGTSHQELMGMTENIEQAAELLGSAKVNLILFHCTAVSTLDSTMGDRLVERITRTTGIPATATSLALLKALDTLKARRIVMVTPYRQGINDDEARFFRQHGVEVIREIGLGLPDAESMSRITPDEWYRHTLEMRHPDAEAYFLSCTNIRAVPAIAALERTLGVPVISSNQAMIWHAMRSARIDDPVSGFGTLLSQH